MDKSKKITGLSVASVVRKPSKDKSAILGLKFRSSDLDTAIGTGTGNKPSKAKTSAMTKNSV